MCLWGGLQEHVFEAGCGSDENLSCRQTSVIGDSVSLSQYPCLCNPFRKTVFSVNFSVGGGKEEEKRGGS